MNRRDILKLGALASAGGLAWLGKPSSLVGGPLPSPNGSRSPAREHVRPGAARNIIFYAYDGTGYEDLAAAHYFSERVLGRPLRLGRLLAEGRTGSMLTHSLTSVVTDSAAATTTWATGRKVVNAALSLLPDGTPLTTILDLARDGGLATGLVTTTRITHATPAGWIARVHDRNEEDEIAEQYLDFGPDVLLGGGRGHFEAGEREDGRDLLGEYRDRGYEVLRTRDDLMESRSSRVLGVFTPGTDHLPYEIDRRFQDDPAPSLADITRKGLEILSGSERGFVAQVEAGRIDHANHQNDPGAMIWDWVAAEEALAEILDFVERDGETLLILAADHDTGGGVVYGHGPWYLRSTQAFETLTRRKASQERLIRRILPPEPSPREVEQAALEHMGAPVSREGAEGIASLLAGEDPERWRWGHPDAHRDQPHNAVAHILSTHTPGRSDRPNVAFATGAHTAGVVPAVVYGAGVEPGNLGIVDNTDLFHMMTGALGLEHDNPALTEEEALELRR